MKKTSSTMLMSMSGIMSTRRLRRARRRGRGSRVGELDRLAGGGFRGDSPAVAPGLGSGRRDGPARGLPSAREVVRRGTRVRRPRPRPPRARRADHVVGGEPALLRPVRDDVVGHALVDRVRGHEPHVERFRRLSHRHPVALRRRLVPRPRPPAASSSSSSSSSITLSRAASDPSCSWYERDELLRRGLHLHLEPRDPRP